MTTDVPSHLFWAVIASWLVNPQARTRFPIFLFLSALPQLVHCKEIVARALTMMDFPDTLERKLDLVTRFIRDIRRVAHKLGEGGAPFLDLQALYDLADLFQRVSLGCVLRDIDDFP